MELAEKNGISPARHRVFSEFYSSVAVIDENNPLLAVITVFCVRIWNKKDFNVSDVKNEKVSFVSSLNHSLETEGEDLIADMEAMEKRYKYENEMMRAVSEGQINKLDFFTGKFNYNLLIQIYSLLQEHF